MYDIVIWDFLYYLFCKYDVGFIVYWLLMLLDICWKCMWGVVELFVLFEYVIWLLVLILLLVEIVKWLLCIYYW